MTHHKSYALSALFFAFLLVFTGCSSTPPAEPATSTSETKEKPMAEETAMEGTRVYGGGYSLIMPAGWVQAPGDDSILIYEESGQGLNAFNVVGFSYDGTGSTVEEIAEKRKTTSDYYYEKFFKNDPATSLLHEGLEFTSFGTTYTLILEGEVNDGTKVHPVGMEQWVFVDETRILRFYGSWEKGNAEVENAVIDILFSVELN
ncbi:MAG: hypothetical protein AAB383_04545 [Patescibacteria group bacterium]